MSAISDAPPLAEVAERARAAGVEVSAPSAPGGPWCARPDDADAVVRLVQVARAVAESRRSAELRLVPVGGGTRLAAARPDLAAPRALAATLCVDMARLSGVVEYEPGDGTLTALAGTAWVDLAAHVARGGHELTPDVAALGEPWRAGQGGAVLGSGRSTLGGVLGAAASGPDRAARGPVRQHVLGAVVATGSGTLARSGGRLVKNVTGFDVFRLHVGGRGTLGVIVEASLRLVPRAEHEALVWCDGLALDAALAQAEAVRQSGLAPRALWVTNVLRDGHTLALHLAGRRAQIDADLKAARAALGVGARHVEGDEARQRARELADTRARVPGANEAEAEDLALAVTCVPSAAAGVGRELRSFCVARGTPAHSVAWPSVARFELALPAPAGAALAADGGRLLRDLAARLRGLGADIAFAGGARAGAEALAGQTRELGARRWERALRLALDPSGLFRAHGARVDA